MLVGHRMVELPRPSSYGILLFGYPFIQTQCVNGEDVFLFLCIPPNELQTNIHEWSYEVVRMNIESDVVFLIQCIFVQILWSQSYNNCSGFLVL